MVTMNPTVPRDASAPASAGARAQAVNVGETERLASMFAGGAVALGGLAFCPSTIGKIVSAALGGALVYRGVTGHSYLYDLLNVNTAEQHSPQAAVAARSGVKVEQSVIVNRPAAELYRFWRRLDQLPRFMSHLKEVRVTDHRHSHWVARGPLGVSVEWDAEIINETPNEMIAWRSLPGSQVDTAGSVHFRPVAGGATEVRVSLKYDPPAGKVGAAVARLFGEAPEQQIRDDLNRFNRMMEANSAAAPMSTTRI